MINIKVGDCREVLKSLADNSVNCCVTSPPYYNLRDYGEDNQIGLENTPDKYVNTLVAVFKELKRVLKNDGTLWLNLGDTYSTGSDLKPKNLLGIPWKVAFALQNDGWILRQDIIWHKPNPMPESVKDRCTKAHEYIFLLSKSEQYYYDSHAIMEDSQEVLRKDKLNVKYNNSKFDNSDQEKKYRQGMHKFRGENIVITRPNLPKKEDFVAFIKSRTNAHSLDEHIDVKKTTIEHWFRLDSGFSYPSKDDWNKLFDYVNDWSKEADDMNDRLNYQESHLDEVKIGNKKNKRSVWTVSVKPYTEAHFATYPPALIEPCILAGCPINGTIIDPFSGAGTTGLVADRLNRNAILIELNKNFAEISKKRLFGDAPLFTEIKRETL